MNAKQPEPFVVTPGGVVRDRASGTVIGEVFGRPRHWSFIAETGVPVRFLAHKKDKNGYAHAKRDAAQTLHRAWVRAQ